MAGPSFPNGQEGKEAPLTAQSRTRGAYRLPFIDNTRLKNTITASQWQEPPPKDGGFFDGLLGASFCCPLSLARETQNRPHSPHPQDEKDSPPAGPKRAIIKAANTGKEQSL